MNTEPVDSNGRETTALQCMEIWGGNSTTERDVSTPGLDIHVHSRPYRQSEGGGDVHYVSLCGGGMITRLILADVSGHGASVSEVAKSLRGLMRKHINRKDQSSLVSSLNREFTDLIEMRRFATAVVATYLTTSDRLKVSNAGHPAPLLRRARDRTWCYLDQPVVQGSVSDIPLGIEESAQYGSHELTLEPEDLVLFYTDAFIEAEDPQGRLLGEEGLLELVRATDVDDPAAFSWALLDAIERYRGGAEATDDETFILLRHNAGPARRRGIMESLKVYAKVLGLSET
ncbi:MAG: PP2C family protein-serine/threonine phosphatase [Isosphaeraceae bacterium]|nr:PP2C family protein-serine/threonine phosphatase [Isosphaeraceae bacterium]